MANNRDLKVVFPDGNIVSLNHENCTCPNKLDVNIIDLLPGKKYTVFIKNLNNTPVRTFPESYSFVAKDTNKTLSFYYQYA